MMGESVVVGFVVRNRWWEVRLVNGFRRMGWQWVGWQWQWVGVWDAVGRWVVAVFFLIFIRWCWWMWVCAVGGCRRCCSRGGCAIVVDNDDDDDGGSSLIYYFNVL